MVERQVCCGGMLDQQVIRQYPSFLVARSVHHVPQKRRPAGTVSANPTVSPSVPLHPTPCQPCPSQQCHAVLRKSGLTSDVLTRIWTLSDVNADGFLDRCATHESGMTLG